MITIFNKYGNRYDFNAKLKIYQTIYPLEKEEVELLHIFMMVPPKIEFKGNEYDLCNYLSSKLELLYRAHKIVLPNKFKDSKKDDQNKD